MYISDKDLTKIVILPYFLGTLALNGITTEKEKYFNVCKNFYTSILTKYNKDINKINNRLDKLINLAILEIYDKQNFQINTHKTIIAINAVAQMALDNDELKIDNKESILELFKPFQEIEARMDMSDEDWLALKMSADKQAKKIYNIFYT